MAKNTDQEFLEFVVQSLADYPKDVKVERKVDEMGVLLTLHINAADMGKILGRQGNTAKSIRTLLRIVGLKNSARVNLKIAEPEGGKGPRVSRGEDRGESQGRGASMNDVMDDLKL